MKNGLKTAGFTLVEVLIVVGLMAIIMGAGMAVSFDSYRGYLFRAEHTNVAHVLATARNHSVNNWNEEQHGVKFLSTEYVLFTGNDYATSDPDLHKAFPRNDKITVTGADEIVFEQLSGNLDTIASSCGPCTITFDSGGARQQVITINEAGGIIW